jgi:selenide,water dikinase
VQGVVHPDRVFRKAGARVGDVLVLSKPLGTGLALAAGHTADAIAGMRRLNRGASEALSALGDAVHAVTDVTGYGLAGHGWEMAQRSGVRFRIDTGSLPTYEGALAAAQSGLRTGGHARNLDYVTGHLIGGSSAGPSVGPGGGALDPAFEAICLDPQTSGGLLAAVHPSAVAQLDGFTLIGEVVAGSAAVELH